MDIKLKDNELLDYILKAKDIIFLTCMIALGGTSIRNKKYFIIIGCLIFVGIIFIRLVISKKRISELILYLDEKIYKNHKREIKSNFKKDFIIMVINDEKNKNIFKSIDFIDECINDYIKSSKDNEEMNIKLIDSVVNKLDTPLNILEEEFEKFKNNDENDLELLAKEANLIKNLTDELFEACKVKSNVLNLNKSDVDVKYILKQSIAEYKDYINKKNLILNVELINESIMLNVDPEKMWRVFQILIENIIKHSLENTRVYINEEISNEEYIIIFKNISKEALNINSEDLFKIIENKEKKNVTGLQLEIVKSIVTLMNGKFNIYIDGDLFKTEIRFKRLEGLNNDSSTN